MVYESESERLIIKEVQARIADIKAIFMLVSFYGMTVLHTSTVVFSLMLALGTLAVDSMTERVSTSPVVIAGDGTCPTSEVRHDSLQLLRSRNGQVMHNYRINLNCGPGQWRQLSLLLEYQ